MSNPRGFAPDPDNRNRDAYVAVTLVVPQTASPFEVVDYVNRALVDYAARVAGDGVGEVPSHFRTHSITRPHGVQA